LEIVVEGGANRETQEIILKRILDEPLSSSIIIKHKCVVKVSWYSYIAEVDVMMGWTCSEQE
jgi:hypothetical protein